jgi:hypothetical protein
MTTIAILPENADAEGTSYHAFAGELQSVGKTPGEALDALTAQLGDQAASTLAIVQYHRPDRFFSEQQEHRLSELMARWRAARDSQSPLPAAEQAELEALVDAELQASTERAKELLDQLPP